MAQKPKISVVVPIYNVQDYLPKCIESLTAQDFKDFEVILLDDCSPDDSHLQIAQICASDKRFKGVKHKANKGLAGARNTGLAEASGEYVYFLDSDDYIAPDALGILFETIEKHSSDFVIGKVLHWYPDENDTTEEDYLEPCQRNSVFATSIDRNPEFAMHVVAWHKLIKRSFLVEHDFSFVELLRKHEDNPFTARLFYLASNFSFNIDSVLFYRQRRDPDNPSIMALGDLQYNTRYKWLCLKHVFEGLISTGDSADLDRRRVPLVVEANKTTDEIIHWKLLQLERKKAIEMVKEMKPYFVSLTDDQLKKLLPEHYFIGSALKQLQPPRFIDFLVTYYKDGTPCPEFTKATSFGWKVSNFLETNRLKKKILKKGIFDEAWYVKTYPAVENQSIAPLDHFLELGSWQLKSPSAAIDLKEFVENKLPDLDLSHNPIATYLAENS